MDIDKEPKIIAWKNSVVQAGCTIGGLRSLNIMRRKNNELLFALLDADIRSPEGYPLPNIVFVRGDACLVVPLIRNRETGEERFLMVRQRRTGNGSLSLEFPAGMLDAEVDNPRGVAARELAEETGIAVPAGDLFPLSGKKLYSSAGASDEGVFYFGCIKVLDDGAYRAIAGRTGGNPEENEHISTALVSREEAEKEATSLQVMLGFYLFEKHRNPLDKH